MTEDIERLLNTPPSLFEKRVFHIESELHFLEKQIAQDTRIAAALDRVFDDLLEQAVADCADVADGEEFAATRAQIRTMRGYRLSTNNEQLTEQMTRIFGQLHELHSLYRGKTR
jgi:uncharacterized membrane protein YccC